MRRYIVSLQIVNSNDREKNFCIYVYAKNQSSSHQHHTQLPQHWHHYCHHRMKSHITFIYHIQLNLDYVWSLRFGFVLFFPFFSSICFYVTFPVRISWPKTVRFFSIPIPVLVSHFQLIFRSTVYRFRTKLCIYTYRTFFPVLWRVYLTSVDFIRFWGMNVIWIMLF